MKRAHFSKNGYYHLFNKGVDARIIFATRGDFERFKAYLYLLNDEDSPRASNFFVANRHEDIYESARANPLVAIGAFSLLPDHFHILATPLVENGVPRFMQKVLTAYTMYFNERTRRSGSLFQGPYKSQRIDDDKHLKYLYAHIHFSSASYFHDDWRAASVNELWLLEKHIATYPYSSAPEYFTSRFVIASPKHFPRALSRAKDIESHLRFWTRLKDTYGSQTITGGN